MYDDAVARDIAERAAYLDQLDAQARRRHWERHAIPALTGDLAADLAAADEAVTVVESAWDDADREYLRAQADAGPFPDPETYRQVTRAKRRRDELWSLRERAVSHRDRVEAAEARHRDRSWFPGEPGTG